MKDTMRVGGKNMGEGRNADVMEMGGVDTVNGGNADLTSMASKVSKYSWCGDVTCSSF